MLVTLFHDNTPVLSIKKMTRLLVIEISGELRQNAELGDPQRHGLMPYHNNLPVNLDVI